MDVRVSLIHNGKNLLSTPFNPTNCNLFGTKLLGIFFSQKELANGTVEPIDKTIKSLDQSRVNLIKGIEFSFRIIFKVYI